MLTEGRQALEKGEEMKREIRAQTTISGFVNGQQLKGKVVALVDRDRGGRSSCEFSELPRGFNPGTFGTHG
jgi:hypothetical protein